ncbi:mitochondrial import inner membrane translocase subunit TIM50, putative [Plasmodium ovale wallikeri]|uniref:Mitochondrial import inner membrane translocase subunit TIM50 n=2 Tax=Plasmodium ovale TaxID=36330 RepID=A0A1A8YIQ3_PLAOA|nr:mitochondrial import inner membrane translocase subunit TIM50, putative [Plasmodium ovale wallikeri]SBT31408.1 mitochondrial import inner membrane translocase subunit TIM50, putative [Plasmodium ovale wallikeri]
MMISFLSLKNLRNNGKKLVMCLSRRYVRNKVGGSCTMESKNMLDVNQFNKDKYIQFGKNYFINNRRYNFKCRDYHSSDNYDGILSPKCSNHMSYPKIGQEKTTHKRGNNKQKGKINYVYNVTYKRSDLHIRQKDAITGWCSASGVGSFAARCFFSTICNGTKGGDASTEGNPSDGNDTGSGASHASTVNAENSENQNNIVNHNSANNNGGKTAREMYLNKKEREKMIKMYLLLSLLLMPFGHMYMYCNENNLSLDEFIKIIKKKVEILENKYNDILHNFIDTYFPLSNEPLLPDFKDLNYPENLPTLVIDLNYVIAKLEYNRKTGWRVLKRPYADLFFKELSSFYEIVIWSDDNFPVAQEVISKWGIPAIGCLHRDQCLKKKKFYVKDLKRLGRNLDRVVIIDHDIHAFMLQPENGILIKEFHGDVNDKEIFCLIDLLKSFAISTYDISQFLKKYGGGDYNIGKRYMQLKNDTEQKSQRIRNFGKIFHLDNKKAHGGISFNS